MVCRPGPVRILQHPPGCKKPRPFSIVAALRGLLIAVWQDLVMLEDDLDAGLGE